MDQKKKIEAAAEYNKKAVCFYKKLLKERS